MQTTIYLYHIDDRKTLQTMQFIAVRLGAKVKHITEDMAGQKVGYIAGLNGFTDEISAEEFTLPTEQMMLLQGFTSQKIDQLLALFRTAGIPRINLKAMLTENNQNWFLYELYEELKREHEEFNKPALHQKE